jgi:glutamine amidotransferase
MRLDLSVANGPDDRMVLVATEPLTRNENWLPFVPGELRVFVAGEPVWQRLPRAAEPTDTSRLHGSAKGIALPA